MKKSRFFLLLPLAFFVSCASTPTKSHEEQNAIEKALTQATANLYGTIAIADIKGNAETTAKNETYFYMQKIIEESEKLTLTDRNHIDAIRREIKFNQSDYVTNGMKVIKGNIFGTFYVIYPTMNKDNVLYFEIIDIEKSTVIATAKVDTDGIPGISRKNPLAKNPLAWIIIGIMTVGLPLGI